MKLKKTFMAILTIFSLGASGCSKDNLPDNITHDYLWENNYVNNEQVLLYEHEDGSISGELLFTPKEIKSITNYFKTETYNSSDYELSGRKIILKNNRMPFLPSEVYNCQNMGSTNIGTLDSSVTTSPSKKVMYTEYPYLEKFSICVTYTHEDKWFGYEPYRMGDRMKKTRKLLADKKDIIFAIYGDSNATGAVASKYWKDNSGPGQTHEGATKDFPVDFVYQEGFPEGFVSVLEKRYGSKITLKNYAVGGQVSSWGKENVEKWTKDSNPDLVYICFGNNDTTFNVNTEVFINNTKTMIDTVLNNNKNAEIIISLPKTNNPLSDQGVRNGRYNKELKKLVMSYETGVIFSDMTSLVADFLKHKGPYDLFGNGVNHANDFLTTQFIDMFAYNLEQPEKGKEYNYDKDPTIAE